MALAVELATPEKNPHTRQLAGLILKKALDAQDEATRQQRIDQWIVLDANTKLNIKARVVFPSSQRLHSFISVTGLTLRLI